MVGQRAGTVQDQEQACGNMMYSFLPVHYRHAQGSIASRQSNYGQHHNGWPKYQAIRQHHEGWTTRQVGLRPVWHRQGISWLSRLSILTGASIGTD